MLNRKYREGVVVSDKMDKSIIVSAEQGVMHPLYKKRIKRTKRYVAHDPKSEAKVGDVVKIVEIRPLSKTKKWRLVEIMERGE